MTRKLMREVVIETREIWFPLSLEHAARPVCPVCAGVLLAPAEAAALLVISQRQLFRWLEQGQVHFCEMAAGELFFCAASLPPGAQQSQA